MWGGEVLFLKGFCLRELAGGVVFEGWAVGVILFPPNFAMRSSLMEKMLLFSLLSVQRLHDYCSVKLLKAVCTNHFTILSVASVSTISMRNILGFEAVTGPPLQDARTSVPNRRIHGVSLRKDSGGENDWAPMKG